MNYLSDTLLHVTADARLPEGFCRLPELPLVIFVGLTGVGKTTTLEHLQEKIALRLLPNRRQITDQVIIAHLQTLDGQPHALVTDRLARFDYTARYRAMFPGGMAHALTQLAAKVPPPGTLLLFDGLRGLEEVQHAVDTFPQARFIVLDAPDIVRLNRLLIRDDAFDAAALQGLAVGQDILAALTTIPDIETVFSTAEQHQIGQLAQAAGLSPEEVIKKTAIIIEERRNYDSQAAQSYLAQTLPPSQALVVDTARHGPEAVVEKIRIWLGNER